MRSNKARHAPGLDGVRALAVLAVMGYHEGARALTGGFLGVDVFFVLSGFLITDVLISRRVSQRLSLADFWMRRARRLLPPLLVMLLVVTAATALIEPSAIGELRDALLAAVTYTSNWYQLLHHISYFASFGPLPPLQHLWSLGIEEQFYLIWPLVLFYFYRSHNGRRSWITALLLVAVASATAMGVLYTQADPSLVYYATGTHAFSLLIGCALAFALPMKTLGTSKAALTRRLDAAGVAGLAILAWAFGHLSGSSPTVYPYGMVLVGLAAAALVAAAASRGAVAAITGLAPLRWIGVRSYAMYLWHWPVIALTGAVIMPSAGASAGAGAGAAAAGAAGAGAAGAGAVRAPLLWLAETAITVGLAEVSWRFVESPVLRDGVRGTANRWLRELRDACTLTAVGTQRITTFSVATAALIVVAVAAHGIGGPAHPAVQAGLLRQVAEGERISASTRQLPAASPASPASPAPASGAPVPSAARGVTGAKPVRHSTRPQRAHPQRAHPQRAHPQRAQARARGGAASCGSRIDGYQVTAVGDSVMLASAAALEQAMPGIYIDAKVGRQMPAGVALVQSLAATGRLRHYVVVGLGSNGAFNTADIWHLRLAAGSGRELILVTSYGPMPWVSTVNAAITGSTWHRKHVAIADWAHAIAAEPTLLWGDGVHPQPSGARLYAHVVESAIRSACH